MIFMIFMVDGCSALQMADVLRAARPPAAELYVLACVESHALLLHTQFGGYLKSHISNIQNLRGGKYLSLFLSFSQTSGRVFTPWLQ